MNVKQACGAGVFGLILLSQDGIALTYNYSFFSSVEYSDNLAQVQPDNATGQAENESGQALNAGVDFSLSTEQNATLAASMNGSYARNEYSLDELSRDDEKLLNASILYQPVSSNFRLSILESLRQVAADRTATQTINNTRDINIFSVVPSYFITLSPVSQLTTDYRYSKINDREGDNSREINAGTLGFQRQASSFFTWSLNARNQNTEFLETGQEFDQEEGFVGLQGGRGLTSYTLEVGRQRIINDDELSEYAYQSSVRFSLARQINSFSNIGLNYRQGYGDLINVDLENSLVQVSANGEAAFVDGVVEEKQVNLNYNHAKRNLIFLLGLSGSSIKNDDEVLNNPATVDEDRYFLNVGLSNRFTGSGIDPLSYGFSLQYRYEERKFNLTDQENEIGTAIARISYFHSDKLETFFEVSSRDSSGDGPRSNFDEKRAIVGFRFSPRGREDQR